MWILVSYPVNAANKKEILLVVYLLCVIGRINTQREVLRFRFFKSSHLTTTLAGLPSFDTSGHNMAQLVILFHALL